MSNKNFQHCSLILGLILIASLITGCATPTPVPTAIPTTPPTATEAPVSPAADTEPTQVPPTPTHEPVHLVIWSMDRVGTNAMAAVKTVIEQWASETGNTVEVVEGNQFEMLGKIPQAIPAGEGPDLFMNLNNYIGGQYAAQLIAPLEAALPDDEQAQYTQGALDAFTLDGQLLGVPIAADVNALVYNQDLVATPPATMDELISLSRELTQGDQYGFLYPIDNFYYSYPFFSHTVATSSNGPGPGLIRQTSV